MSLIYRTVLALHVVAAVAAVVIFWAAAITKKGALAIGRHLPGPTGNWRLALAM